MNTRKHADVSTTPNPSPSRQQLVKKSCHRHVFTQSKYFMKKMASSNNTTPPVALKDDADKSIVVHDSSPLLSHINQPHHTTSKICSYDVGGVQTTMKSSPASTPDRKPFGDIGNSPTKLLSNSATRSTTKSLLSQQSPSFIALQPFGTTTKTIKPPPLLEQEDANLATISNVNATDADTLPATLPVAAPTRIRKPRPRHEIEATLRKNGRDLDSEKSMRRLKSAIMISERNSGARLPDDMNCILYQSKPSNVNKERVIRARRFYSYFEYSIGSDNDDDRKVFYRGRIAATDAANAFSELDFTVSYGTIRKRAGKDGGEPSLLGDLISVKEVIECIFDYDTGFVGTNEEELEASKDMIRQNLKHLKAEVFSSYFEYSIGGDNDDDRKVFYKGTITASDAANAFAALGFTASYSTIRKRAGKDGSEPSLLGGLITVKEVIDCIFDYETGFVGTNEEEVEASKDMIRHNLQRLDKAARQEEIFARMDAEKKEREEKQRLINESFVPLGGRSVKSVVEDTVNAYLLAEKKELADIKDNARRVY